MLENDIALPEMLDFPDKLLPIINEFNNYTFFLIEGGRDSAKSHSVGRLLLYLGEHYKIRILCGREEMARVEESVYTLLRTLIERYDLNYEVQNSKIVHRRTETEFNFRGFREIGAENTKGIEDVDILWVDEAQTLTQRTIDVLIPTLIRNDKIRVFFTMNRFERHDPAYEFCIGRKDCLHIKINYYENKHCGQKAKEEAEICRLKDEAKYRHDWLGEPYDQTEDYLISSLKLDEARTIIPFGDLFVKQSAMAVDLAGSGGDYCVASLLRRKSNVHWELEEQRRWREKDPDLCVGRVVALKSLWEPALSIVDADGLGGPLYELMKKQIPDLQGFHGAGEAREKNSGNQRADGYLAVNDFINKGWIILGKFDRCIKQLERIKRKYLRNGLVYIQPKQEMRNDKDVGESPDDADSLMMGIYAIKYLLGKVKTGSTPSGQDVQRLNKRRQ